jgi:hypothetical protein
MTLNLKYDFMKLIKIILAVILTALMFSTFSQSPGNFSTLRVTTLNGNMKANGSSLVTADTVLLKSDTLRADTQIFFRGDSLIKVIQDNSTSLNVVGNVNNRVLTATGGDSIQGEANFTFDGSTATVTGDIDATGYVEGGNVRISGNLVLGTGGSGDGLVVRGTTTSNTSTDPVMIFSVLQNGALITGRPLYRWNNFNTTIANLSETGQFQLTATTNQLRLGTTNTTTITSPAPAASRTYTIPDALGAANFALTDVGASNRVPYWTSSGKMTNTSTFTFNGSSLTNSLGGTYTSNFNNTGLSGSKSGNSIYTLAIDGFGAGVSSSFAIRGISRSSATVAQNIVGEVVDGNDSGGVPALSLSAWVGSSPLATRPTLAGYNLSTKQWEVAANGTWDYQGNALTGISQATISNTGSTAGLTVTKSGSGNGITVTNSGSGLAGQFGNIGINANTISSTNTDGNILLTPNGTGFTNITVGGLRIAGTERISNAGALTATTGSFSGNVSLASTGANTVSNIDANRSFAGSEVFNVISSAQIGTNGVAVYLVTAQIAAATHAQVAYVFCSASAIVSINPILTILTEVEWINNSGALAVRNNAGATRVIHYSVLRLN